MKLWIIVLLLLVGLCLDRSSAEDEPVEEAEKKHDFQVSITGLEVKITCPEPGELTLNGKGIRNEAQEHILENYSSDKNGMYKCKNDYLYLHAYVCETCVEVSAMMVASVVIADCLITIGVCLFVYMFCKKKPGQVRESGYTKGARNKGNKERPPPVPNPDYEPIKKRGQDLYDGLNQGIK
ncbi:T-cell surface glycoprotein CD3 epsilon chain [Dendropsophus ebraccatus]|uniref:T-cell surface glycoprotein CD3 epsilon chain n=1 Tax=Dendropsophus ebraccatus TaxID=150705 RepID=UPI003831568D